MQRSFRFLSETTKDVVSETTDFSKVDLSSECIENTVTGRSAGKIVVNTIPTVIT